MITSAPVGVALMHAAYRVELRGQCLNPPQPLVILPVTMRLFGRDAAIENDAPIFRDRALHQFVTF